jgi:hypothetical protein
VGGDEGEGAMETSYPLPSRKRVIFSGFENLDLGFARPVK